MRVVQGGKGSDQAHKKKKNGERKEQLAALNVANWNQRTFITPGHVCTVQEASGTVSPVFHVCAGLASEHRREKVHVRRLQLTEKVFESRRGGSQR